MKLFVLLGRLVVLGIVGTIVVRQSAADPPDILRDYRFVTSRSTVLVSGGNSTPYDLKLAIDGRFGVVTGYEYGVDPTAHIPTLTPRADFVDVHAILFNPLSAAPIPVPGWDLDKTLNLTGLNGTFSDPSLLHFSGVDGQGAPIKLEAAVHDPLIHIVGANDPHCAACSPDLLGYKIDAVGLLRKQADFNGNGMIDAADYLIWRKTSLASAMTDEDGQLAIGPSDYFDLWRAEFGQIVNNAGGAAGASLTDATVPEPATLAFALVAATLFGLRRGRLVVELRKCSQ